MKNLNLIVLITLIYITLPSSFVATVTTVALFTTFVIGLATVVVLGVPMLVAKVVKVVAEYTFSSPVVEEVEEVEEVEITVATKAVVITVADHTKALKALSHTVVWESTTTYLELVEALVSNDFDLTQGEVKSLATKLGLKIKA